LFRIARSLFEFHGREGLKEEKMTHFGKIAAATLLVIGAGTVSASADDCSGRSHDTGTAVGAVGGGLIGGLATHSVAGGLGGAVIGGLAGNAIARNDDCHHSNVRAHRQSYYTDRDGHRHYYTR
jgi:hypothetical protein